MTKTEEKNTTEQYFFFFFDQKMLIPRPPYRTSKLQEKPLALKGEHPALQKMKFLTLIYFCGSFLPS
jgi:hypothetical protein